MAPLAVKVVGLPEQIGLAEAVIATVGVGETVTVICDVFVQPLRAVPVTVYVVVAAGETTIGFPLILPGFQTYVEAPPPVNVTLPPRQKFNGPFAEMVGVIVELPFVVTNKVSVARMQLPSVTV